jgi:protein TonB
MKNWNDPANVQRIELLFENRNKSYGAYVIRREYYSALAKAYCSVLIFSTLLLIYSVLFKKSNLTKARLVHDVIVDIIDARTTAPVIKQPATKNATGVKKSTGQYVAADSSSAVVEEDSAAIDLTNDTTEAYVDKSTTINNSIDTNTYDFVSLMPQFPGGDLKLLQYLSANIHYPAHALEADIKGTVYINFTIGAEGQVLSAEVKRGIGYGCDEEALRVIRQMPQWTPGSQGGKPVKVRFMAPIKFSLK